MACGARGTADGEPRFNALLRGCHDRGSREFGVSTLWHVAVLGECFAAHVVCRSTIREDRRGACLEGTFREPGAIRARHGAARQPQHLGAADTRQFGLQRGTAARSCAGSGAPRCAGRAAQGLPRRCSAPQPLWIDDAVSAGGRKPSSKPAETGGPEHWSRLRNYVPMAVLLRRLLCAEGVSAAQNGWAHLRTSGESV